MIIWIASYPRSGNTLFRMAMNVGFGLTSYSAQDHIVFDQLEGVTNLIGHKKLSLSLKDMRETSDIFYIKTHEHPKDDSRAIYIVRDGRDALSSYARYHMRFRTKSLSRMTRVRRMIGRDPFSEIFKQLAVGQDMYGSWSNHVEAWLSKNKNVALVKYEDLVNNPVSQVADSLQQLGIPVGPPNNGLMPTFSELHSRWPSFFDRGKAGVGKEEIKTTLLELFWKHNGRGMDMVGYSKL